MLNRGGPWALKGKWDLDGRRGEERGRSLRSECGQSLRLEWSGCLIGIVGEASRRVEVWAKITDGNNENRPFDFYGLVLSSVYR